MNKIAYTTNHRRNLVLYWRQFNPQWCIPPGYHVHHIKPKCTFANKDDPRIHHPSNLIALHPDDHVSIHRNRGDKFVSEHFIWHIAGKRWTEESKLKISKTRMGHIVTAETRKKLSIANTGKVVSDETKQKIRDANLGKKHGPRSEKAKQNIRNAVKKAMQRPEVKQRQRDSHLGNTWTEETKRKVSESRTGTKLFNNGIVNKLFRPGSEPNEFVLGKVR